jgi:cold shock CspA family protein
MSDQYITAKNIVFQNYKIWCWTILIMLMTGNFSVSAATAPDSEEFVQQLGIQKQDLPNLNKGEIVYFNVAEGDEKELAAGAVIYMPIAPAKIIAYIKSKGLLSIDTEIKSEGAIPLQASLDTFKGFSFKSGSGEASDFLTAKPGSQFNLSAEEFQSLKSTSSSQPDTASKAYQKILLQRWQAYRKNGLKGIATYDRGNSKAANPGGELLTATQNNKVLARYFPELYKAWLNYPAAFPASAEEKFLWRNRQVENRPTAILTHRVMMSTGTGEVILARQFYVGHSYNSNQLTIACLPYRDGSLVFYANRTFTDQVAGFGSSLKHSIGQKQAQSEMTKQLKNLRKSVK